MVFKERMWFPLIHTTITHISNFIFGHHDLRKYHSRTATSLSPGHTWFHHWSHQYQSIPINTNQCSGNHPPTKILDKRTTWITSQMTQFKPATIANLHLWPLIKITYTQPTNLDPLPIESNIEQTLQPKEWPSPRPTSKSQARVDQNPDPSPQHESPCLWASLSIEHNRLTLPTPGPVGNTINSTNLIHELTITLTIKESPLTLPMSKDHYTHKTQTKPDRGLARHSPKRGAHANRG